MERLEFYDTLCPGLRLRITPAGKKTFSAVYRVKGRLQRYTIGRYPVFSLSDARQKALALQREAADGVDPRGQAKEAVAAAISLSQLINDYARLHLEPNVKSGTKILSILRNRHLHSLQARLVGDISKREFIDAIDLVMADGTPTAASNLLRNLKMLLNWAVQRDSIAINVLQGVRPPSKAVERDRVLTDHEIRAIWRATFKLRRHELLLVQAPCVEAMPG